MKALVIDMATYSEQRIDNLIDECTKVALQQIVGPFGLSVAMFVDRDGGAVDTIHNAKKGVMSDELKNDYANRGEYDSAAAHNESKAYTERKKELNRQKKEGTLKDAYSDTMFSGNDETALDHVMAAKEVHDDAARVLAEIDTADLANLEENLQMTGRSLNSAMKDKSMDEFIQYLESTKDERRERINELKSKDALTDVETKELNKLQQQEDFDPKQAMDIDRRARKAIQRAESRKYYTSPKFIKNQLKASGKEAATNAIRAAIGDLLVILVNQTFIEVKAFIKERKAATENIFVEIQNRLKRVIARVLEKLKNWRDNLKDMAEGFISGFCSSLITTLKNVFATTAKRFVRAIREGIFSLIKAFKILFFRPAEMTEEEAMKTVVKLLAGVAITTLGIVAETAVNSFIQSVPLIGQFASIVTPAVMGILTGIAIALISYYVDMVFHFAKMNEDTFKDLLEAGRLQGVYSEMLTRTGEIFLGMSATYERMVETNEEIMYGLNEVEAGTGRILNIYASVNMTALGITDGNRQLGEELTRRGAAVHSLSSESETTLRWIKSRNKSKRRN